MNKIKVYKEKVVINLINSGEIEREGNIEEFDKYLLQFQENDFIKLGEKRIRKHQIISYEPKIITNELDNFIDNLSEPIKQMVIDKRLWLKKQQGKEMTLSYAKNFIKQKNTCNLK